MMPIRPKLSRKAISFSPRSFRRIGVASGFSSSGRQAGIQYSRISSPIGVPGPTRVRISLLSIESIGGPPQVVRYPYFGTIIEGGARNEKGRATQDSLVETADESDELLAQRLDLIT